MKYNNYIAEEDTYFHVDVYDGYQHRIRDMIRTQ